MKLLFEGPTLLKPLYVLGSFKPSFQTRDKIKPMVHCVIVLINKYLTNFNSFKETRIFQRNSD